MGAKQRQILSWEQNGSCNFGDTCRFKHPAKANVHRKVTKRGAKRGDLIMLNQTCLMPTLRNKLGQVYEVDEGIARVQIVMTKTQHDNLDAGSLQWVAMANTVGLPASVYEICPKHKYKGLLCTTSREGRSEGYVNCPYSYKAIFDTGANVFPTDRPELVKNQVALKLPEMMEGQVASLASTILAALPL
jgi:hypothetical protein